MYSIKFCVLINYQDQKAIITDDILPSVPYPVPYSPARQPFLKADIQYSNLSMLTIICSYCHAFYFEYEKLTFLRVNYSKFGMCYLQGQIQLSLLQLLTGTLHNYLIGDNYFLREFCNNIQQYSTAFAITLVEVKINNLVTRQLNPYYFKIQGELHYLTGTLLPHTNQTLIYVQIYILDTIEQLNVRRANNNNLDLMVINNI